MTAYDIREHEAAAQAVRDALDALGEPYEELAVDPELADTEAFCAHYGIAIELSANTIVVASKRGEQQYAACVLLATTRLDVNHAVRPLMGVKKASFASADETRALTGMLGGGVTPFGLPPGVPVYVDARVMECEHVWVGGGGRTTKLKVSPRVFERLPNATVVEGLAAPAS